MICPRCGAPVTPADKFCAICASPIAAQGGPPPGFGAPPPGFGPPPGGPGGFGPPPPAPGYGPPPGGPPGFGPPPGPPGFGPPPGAPPGFGPPDPGFGAPPPPPGFGPPPAFGPPPGAPPGFGPPPQPPGFGPPPGEPGFGPPPPPPPGFGPPPPPPAYGAPPPPPVEGGGYPVPPQPPGYGPPPGQGGPRCVQGHPIPPGGSFCMEGGHPIALEGVQIGSGDAFGATAFAPSPGPPPMAPTGAMSGYGAEQQQPPGMARDPRAAATAQPGGDQAKAAEGGRRTLAGFLVSFQDDPLGKFWPLWQGKNTVGRAETGQHVDVAIGHGTTSTHHAAVEVEGPRMTLVDLGSTNGTFHNEEAIGFQGRRDVRDGDKIRFGGYSVIVFAVAARS